MSEVDKLVKCIRECLDVVESVYGQPRTIKIHPDPEVKPCDHEPERNPNYPGLLAQICRNCGAKIRAEKWVECETKILA